MSTSTTGTSINSTATPRASVGRRLLTVAVCTGAFAGLSGLVAPAAKAEHPVDGRIGEEYVAAAQVNHQTPEEFFGATTSPELPAARGGRFQTFENDKSIYWHPDVTDGQAHQLSGPIIAKWGETTGDEGGWEHGPLRYPTTREWGSQISGVTGESGLGTHFEGGTVYSVPESGEFVTWGLIRTAWWNLGGENSGLGFPVGDEGAVDNGWVQEFEGGSIQAFSDGMIAVATHHPAAAELDTGGPVAVDELG